MSRPRSPSQKIRRITPNTRLSIRIESEFGSRIENNQIVLLETIQAHGSISRAAQFIGLTRHNTHRAIKAINKILNEPAVNTMLGGRSHGGAALSPTGMQLVELYRAIEACVQAVALPERETLHRLMRPKKGDIEHVRTAGVPIFEHTATRPRWYD
jgi:molybdate transport system regulatory protein